MDVVGIHSSIQRFSDSAIQRLIVRDLQRLNDGRTTTTTTTTDEEDADGDVGVVS